MKSTVKHRKLLYFTGSTRHFSFLTRIAASVEFNIVTRDDRVNIIEMDSFVVIIYSFLSIIYV